MIESPSTSTERWIAAETSPRWLPGRICSAPAKSAALVTSSSLARPRRPAPIGTVIAASATQPSLITPTSIESTSPRSAFVGAGDAVDDHRVGRGADRARESAVALEGRLASCERMNFSAASSSSFVVTPGRALGGEHLQAAGRGSRPAAAILSSCSGVLGTIIRYTLAASLGLDRLVGFEPQRRQGPLDLGGDLVRGWRRRRCGAAGSGRRSSRPAARSSRGTGSSRWRITSGLSSSRTTSGLPSMSQTPSFSGGLNSTWKTWPFSSQVRRPPSRRTTSSSSTSISSTAGEPAAELGELRRRAPRPAARCAGSRRG